MYNEYTMQPMKYINQWLLQNADKKHYLFTLHDLRALCPQLSDSTFKTLLSRAVDSEILVRVCRGLYLDKRAMPNDGLFLFYIAASLRANNFNYISLETVLSDVGAISQIHLNKIFIMSSGRSNMIHCGRYY